jgi:hypothetical protein
MEKKKLGINDYHPKLGYVPASEIKRLRRQIKEQMGLVKIATRIIRDNQYTEKEQPEL